MCTSYSRLRPATGCTAPVENSGSDSRAYVLCERQCEDAQSWDVVAVLQRMTVAQFLKPAAARVTWQRIPSFEKLRRTQRLTLATVGLRPMQSRRTSDSQAARICGVTPLGSLKVSAAMAVLAQSNTAETVMTLVVFTLFAPTC